MGLDAVVFCDCVEKGRLKTPHPFPGLLYIAVNGCPDVRSRDGAKIEQHEAWMHSACAHEDMMIDGTHLGNISSIEFMWQMLHAAIPAPERDFPVLCRKVIYDGGHCGDHLTRASVLRLVEELKRLRKIDFSKLDIKKADVKFIDEFQSELSRLVKTAIKIKKPIAF